MSWLGSLSGYLKRLILIEKEIEDMAEDARSISIKINDHEKRLIRIETMIEMSSRTIDIKKLD